MIAPTGMPTTWPGQRTRAPTIVLCLAYGHIFKEPILKTCGKRFLACA
jgi:hypothetical protein